MIFFTHQAYTFLQNYKKLSKNSNNTFLHYPEYFIKFNGSKTTVSLPSNVFMTEDQIHQTSKLTVMLLNEINSKTCSTWFENSEKLIINEHTPSHTVRMIENYIKQH